ncbi:lactoylglutathione lyase/glyoxalase I family protein [Trifolium pratense]|uniref:Lactoylglutathione lyase/glyoxalase I family protein n=1 Tax=Trifolium pratense TaxID=57577 RepID=A0A2K3KSP3_TRIPR|nr:lactoylglutathione lyase/glyoxalase I family protein [Trifolium pratense]
MEINYVRATVEEGGIQVDQLFFHDPDGFMIEICNCDSLPVIPLVGEVARSCARLNLHLRSSPKIMQNQNQNQQQIHKIVK